MNDKQQSLFDTSKRKNTTTTRFTLRQRTLDDLLTVLRNLGCIYYVKDSEGVEFKHGDIVSVKMSAPPAKKRKLEFPMGELSAYIRPLLEPLQPGQTVVIPGGKYGAEKLQSSATSLCSRIFGNGSCISATNKKDNCIEILRVL